MKTRDRILQASLQLFNEQGERLVTTNHIAQHMGMSPGNLYYHFRNKQQIIAELFSHYEAQVDDYLQVPAGRELEVADKAVYLESIFRGLWEYRFLHRDLEHLLNSDAELAGRYRQFSRRCVQSGQTIYQGLVDAGILCAERTDPQALAINSWLLMTGWVGFLCASVLDDQQPELTPELLRRGVYQVLSQETGLLTDRVRPAVEAMLRDYYVPLK
ncbi:TetR/AcrR family transcriptional regulator [Halopseudomonas pelagia]|uniref:TetR family transcriptional regulator n=1 Tax=Halopseudomonas pelagia TaxID=553151 RepID=A0AA91U1K7_9GAMM|nr:TetR/AcrR family transcriptional regulator [Halopseudomonas pelagia]PCC99009.1 TetR family transcriptional regulator [Halopseudomonas pelagia]QFY55399.1 TetR/AcrR family transcriptional regulator [Halopseudomonas pelagia]